MSASKPTVICLMGPTASGKTTLAIELAQRLPCDIISVDSAMVYRGMDIGTAKPDQATLALCPHRLIDIADPKDPYSAGHFRVDALREIKDSFSKGRLPLLVGGTMLYFRVLATGLAPLPKADAKLRAQLQDQIHEEGIKALHAELAKVDPEAASKIHENDSQRIQRALEVYWLTGKTISAWQKEDTQALSEFNLRHLALIPSDREKLQHQIDLRFHSMLKQGLIDEVQRLFDRKDLSDDLPSIRSVGYKQVWAYLAGVLNRVEMEEKAITATRQLAKRQLTWLRSWPDLISFEAERQDLFERVLEVINCF